MTVVDASTDERIERLGRQVDLLVAEMQRQRAERQRWRELTEELLAAAGRPGMALVSERLADLEARGYVDFARSGAGVLDRVVTSFSEDDVNALGENIVTILQTVREMTQPEVMTMLRRTVHTVQDEPGPPPSLLHLIKDLRDPQVRRGLARALQMLRSVGETPAGSTPTRR